MDIQKYAKAIVPVVVLVALALLEQAGIRKDTTVGDAVTLLVTSGLVYLVPNKKS